MIKQLSIYLKNQPGGLARIMNVLNGGGIRVLAMCITDTNENGILRLMADKPERGEALLKEKGFNSTLSRVLVVEIGGPEALEQLFRLLNGQSLNVEYLYSFAPGQIVLKIEESEQAARVLEGAGYRTLTADEATDGGIA